ncbi:hypothetical protein ACJ72_07945, partial [Emergomyces africanus]
MPGRVSNHYHATSSSRTMKRRLTFWIPHPDAGGALDPGLPSSLVHSSVPGPEQPQNVLTGM